MIENEDVDGKLAYRIVPIDAIDERQEVALDLFVRDRIGIPVIVLAREIVDPENMIVLRLLHHSVEFLLELFVDDVPGFVSLRERVAGGALDETIDLDLGIVFVGAQRKLNGQPHEA